MDIATLQRANADRELHWLITSVIGVDVPQLVEALTTCLNLLMYNSPEPARALPVKLPVLLSKSESIKGILVRDGPEIVSMTVQLRERHFNRHVSGLHLSKPYELPQIHTANRAIGIAIDLLHTSQAVLEDAEDHDHRALIRLFNELLGAIQTAKNALQLPTDPTLVFPNNVTPTTSFDPVLPPGIAVDLYVSQGEVCLDLKTLHHVTEEPWSSIGPDGRSYVDNLRDEMKLPSASGTPLSTRSSTPLPDPPISISKIEERLHLVNPTLGHQSPLMSVLGHLLLRKYEPIDYITKCVTYNRAVVMVNKKIEVSSPDPVLVSALTKLDSVEYVIGNYLDSVNKIASAAHN